MVAAVEGDLPVLVDGLIDHNREPVQVPERRHRANIAVGKECGELVLIGQPGMLRTKRSRHLGEIGVL